MQKIKIIQFLPYFPPHTGGLESFVEEFSQTYASNLYGDLINITFSVGQDVYLDQISSEFIIKYNSIPIGYFKDGYRVYILPAFDLISNFPVPKFWSIQFWKVLSIIRQESQIYGFETVILTHTRFFLSSLLGGFFSKIYAFRWVHFEHGADYVKLSSKLKTKFAYIYDKIVGKWIFCHADMIIAISQACGNFIKKEFVERQVLVIYRGIFFKKSLVNKKGPIKLLFIGRLVKLKGIHILLEAYRSIYLRFPDLELIIIGDGEDRLYIEKYIKHHSLFHVTLLGYKDKEFVESHLNENKNIVIVPSLQEGLGTVVVEGLISKNIVIGSNIGGIPEVSDKGDLILFESESVEDLISAIDCGLNEYQQRIGLSYDDVQRKFSWKNNIKYFYSELRVLINVIH